MSGVFQPLNVGALCLLSFVLSSALVSQIWPGVGLVPVARGQTAEQAGVIYVYRQPKGIHAPVQMIGMKEGSEELVPGVFRRPPYEAPGQPIPATDDWIKGLSISVKNVTSIKIEFMHIDVALLYGQERNDLRGVWWYLDLGQIPPVAASTYYTGRGMKVPPGTGQPLEFGPGQVMTVSLSEYADKIQEKIEAKTPVSTVRRCVIDVNVAYFDQPGLEWCRFGSGWRTADPDSPTGYKTLPGFFPGDLSQQTFDRDPPHKADPRKARVVE